ncbi:hypothetical protein NFI96_006593 [Prochilodus magdalenae]|nr:hypothetical protein NFI96_006593 [Prochilodus magdalenae]
MWLHPEPGPVHAGSSPSWCWWRGYAVLGTETGQIDPVLIERYNSPGFVGCLSRVQFNRIAPLKAALRPGVPSTASIQGVLVESNCGALPLTIPPMSAAFDPWQPDAGEALWNALGTPYE